MPLFNLASDMAPTLAPRDEMADFAASILPHVQSVISRHDKPAVSWAEYLAFCKGETALPYAEHEASNGYAIDAMARLKEHGLL